MGQNETPPENTVDDAVAGTPESQVPTSSESEPRTSTANASAGSWQHGPPVATTMGDCVHAGLLLGSTCRSENRVPYVAAPRTAEDPRAKILRAVDSLDKLWDELRLVRSRLLDVKEEIEDALTGLHSTER